MLRSAKDLEEALKGGDAKKAEAKNDDVKKDEAKPAEAKAAADAKGGKTGDTKECVFVVEGGKAKLRAVKSGISDETSVAIVEGLKDGDTVVTGPYRALRDLKNGDAVKEKKAEEAKDKKDEAKAEVTMV
jgi:HlyD family secretion protein